MSLVKHLYLIAATTFAPAVVRAAEGFTVFPVGLNIGKQNVLASLKIRGKEDGSKAVNLDQWLIGFDDLITGLNGKIKELPNGKLEIRTATFIVNLDKNKLLQDPDLGIVISIQEIENSLGIKVDFDINDYAINLEVPQPKPGSGIKNNYGEQPILLDGLTQITPPGFGLNAIQQRLKTSNNQDSLNLKAPEGEFKGVGNLGDSSWYLRINQPEIGNLKTWNLSETTVINQKPSHDWVVGSQPTFWRLQGGGSGGNYWGVTTINRQGFTPPVNFYGGSFIPSERLQSNVMGRTVSGNALPGTVVRLVRGFRNDLLGEVLVDSSGIFRFENVLIDNNIGLGNNLRLLLYPRGQITADPEIRDVIFTTVPGQLPVGAKATIASVGVSRDQIGFLGNVQDVKAGVSQRWGVSESLTMGVGGIYDNGLRGLGEFFWKPEGFPLQASASALIADRVDLLANIIYKPSDSFDISFNSDSFSSRGNLNWRLSRSFTALANYDSLEGTAVGGQLSFGDMNSFTYARATVDDRGRFRWSLGQNLGDFQFNQQGNETGTISDLTYKIRDPNSYIGGQEIGLGYQTNNQDQPSQLATLTWRYRSSQITSYGNPVWDAELGYGIGSYGSGVVASIGTSFIPGLQLRARYQGVSLNNSNSDLSIEALTTLEFSGGIQGVSNTRIERFQNQGGIALMPFYDRNNNGVQDGNEEAYIDQQLIKINHQSLDGFRPENMGNSLKFQTVPGSYRIDLDPAGFPINWRTKEEALRVDVVAGNYTTVPIPLVMSYAVSGVVKDTVGNGVGGARVEAEVIDNKGKRKSIYSITNDSGIYYLEGLEQGKYQIAVKNVDNTPQNIVLTVNSQPLQELNLTVNLPKTETAQTSIQNEVISDNQPIKDSVNPVVINPTKTDNLVTNGLNNRSVKNIENTTKIQPTINSNSANTETNGEKTGLTSVSITPDNRSPINTLNKTAEKPQPSIIKSTIDRRYTLAGIVKDVNGKIVAQGIVKVRNRQNNQIEQVTTNINGIYTITGLTQGEYEVTINDRLVSPKPIVINNSSLSFNQVNFVIDVINSPLRQSKSDQIIPAKPQPQLINDDQNLPTNKIDREITFNNPIIQDLKPTKFITASPEVSVIESQINNSNQNQQLINPLITDLKPTKSITASPEVRVVESQINNSINYVKNINQNQQLINPLITEVKPTKSITP